MREDGEREEGGREEGEREEGVRGDGVREEGSGFQVTNDWMTLQSMRLPTDCFLNPPLISCFTVAFVPLGRVAVCVCLCVCLNESSCQATGVNGNDSTRTPFCLGTLPTIPKIIIITIMAKLMV